MLTTPPVRTANEVAVDPVAKEYPSFNAITTSIIEATRPSHAKTG